MAAEMGPVISAVQTYGDAREAEGKAEGDAELAELQSQLDTALLQHTQDTATIDDLRARLAECEGGDGGPSMLVGASNAVSQKNNPGPLEQQMGLTGDQKLDLFRCYAQSPAPTWAQQDFGEYAGKRGLWLSTKGDLSAYSDPNSSLNQNWVNLVTTYDPKWPPLYGTIQHEIEAKLASGVYPFADILKAVNTWYDVVKPHAPANVLLGPIHGGYGWSPGQATTTVSGTHSATPDEWRTMKGDFHGIDNYGGPHVDDIAKMPRCQRFVKEMLGGDWTKLCIAESGMRQRALLAEAGGDAAKADQAGVDWVHRNGDQLGELGVKVWCMWNSTSTVDPGPMTDRQAAAYGDVWRKWSPQSVNA